MRQARVTKTPDGKGLVELSDPTEFAEFPSELAATSFLLRAGWTPYATSHKVSQTVPGLLFEQPALSVRPFVAVPGPEPAVDMSRHLLHVLSKPLELWCFRLRVNDAGQEKYGFRFGLDCQPFIEVADDPVLSLLAPYPIRLEAIGYWERQVECLDAATMLVEQLENLYGRELFCAALDQNIQRILSAQPR